MSKFIRRLTIKDGVALGIGSIMGSGILFLPSLTYQVSGRDVLVAWALTTFLCLPLLLIFKEMIATIQSEHGLEGWIALGLGEKVAASIPMLMLGTVGIGMPSAALIGAKYVTNLFGLDSFGTCIVALGMIWTAIGANIFGVKVGSSFQRFMAFALFAIGAAILILTFPRSTTELSHLRPTWNFSAILKGSVLAFWAYAGFENMTFMAGEFKNPTRDILWSIIIALLTCGLLYIGLTMNFATSISPDRVDPLAGMFQLSQLIEPRWLTSSLIAAFAVAAVLINLTSWSWGVSRLIFGSAGKGQLPRYFDHLAPSGIPQRALFLLLVVFTTVAVVLSQVPAWMEAGLTVVSTNFVFIYFLSILSYIVVTKHWHKRFFGVALLVPVAWSLTTSGFLLLYPLAIIIACSALAGWHSVVAPKEPYR